MLRDNRRLRRWVTDQKVGFLDNERRLSWLYFWWMFGNVGLWIVLFAFVSPWAAAASIIIVWFVGAVGYSRIRRWVKTATVVVDLTSDEDEKLEILTASLPPATSGAKPDDLIDR